VAAVSSVSVPRRGAGQARGVFCMRATSPRVRARDADGDAKRGTRQRRLRPAGLRARLLYVLFDRRVKCILIKSGL
jgi:hypothetical protein